MIHRLYKPVAYESCTQFGFTPPPQNSYYARSISTRLSPFNIRDSIVLGRHSKKQGRRELDLTNKAPTTRQQRTTVQSRQESNPGHEVSTSLTRSLVQPNPATSR